MECWYGYILEQGGWSEMREIGVATLENYLSVSKKARSKNKL